MTVFHVGRRPPRLITLPKIEQHITNRITSWRFQVRLENRSPAIRFHYIFQEPDYCLKIIFFGICDRIWWFVLTYLQDPGTYSWGRGNDGRLLILIFPNGFLPKSEMWKETKVQIIKIKWKTELNCGQCPLYRYNFLDRKLALYRTYENQNVKTHNRYIQQRILGYSTDPKLPRRKSKTCWYSVFAYKRRSHESTV